MPVKLYIGTHIGPIQNNGKASFDVWGRAMVDNEKPRKQTGCEWDEDASMDVWSREEINKSETIIWQ